MLIRLCRSEDEKDWIALNREFMLFEIAEDSLWNGTEKTPDYVFQNTFREALKNAELITLLIMEKDETPIGFVNLMTIYSVWAHGKALIVDDIFIKKEYQGKGYGREAMAYIEEHAQRNKYKRVQFHSETTNPGARKFYEALGFTATELYFYVKYLG